MNCATNTLNDAGMVELPAAHLAQSTRAWRGAIRRCADGRVGRSNERTAADVELRYEAYFLTVLRHRHLCPRSKDPVPGRFGGQLGGVLRARRITEVDPARS